MTSKKFHEPENWEFRHFKSKSGSFIRYGYASPKEPSRGTVVITGGYGRHIEYYFEKINNWLDRGYTVYAMDWDGQGGSDREHRDKRHRPPTKDFDHHVETLHQFVSEIVKPARSKPVFLSSHSMGGNITLRYLHKYEKDPDFPFTGAILAAPLVRLNAYGLPRAAFRRAVQALDNTGLRHTPLPSIPSLLIDFADAVRGRKRTRRDLERENVHEAYKEKTAYYEIGYPTIGWLRAAIDSCDKVSKKSFLQAIKTPVLIVTAETDGLVCVNSQKMAARNLANGQQVILKDARHGLWYDRDDVQHVLWAEIDRFVSLTEQRFYAARRLLLQIRPGLHNILKP